MRPNFRTIPTLLVALVAIAGLVACQGAGDGGVTASNQQLSRGATYASAVPPSPGQPQVVLSVASGTRDTVCLGVSSYYALDLYSVAFTLQYDPDVMRYTSWQEGSLLGTGSEVLVQVTPQPPTAPDSVVVGVTRNSAVVTGGVTGNGRLITLCFDLVAPATNSPVTFGGANLVGFNSTGTDPANPAHVALDPADFIGGTVTVQ